MNVCPFEPINFERHTVCYSWKCFSSVEIYEFVSHAYWLSSFLTPLTSEFYRLQAEYAQITARVSGQSIAHFFPAHVYEHHDPVSQSKSGKTAYPEDHINIR